MNPSLMGRMQDLTFYYNFFLCIYILISIYHTFCYFVNITSDEIYYLN